MSIIVPIYKVEKYLEQCVESIIAQTYGNWELILVDDGSPDQSGRIADQYASQDSRILVIHKENGGLSDARNAGLEVATGDYITLVDSDDYIHPQMLELMLQAAGDGEEDVVICGYEMVYEGQTPKIQKFELSGVERIDGREIQQVYFKQSDQRLTYTVAWGKLYRRSCFDAIRYPKGKLHEDEHVTFQILYEASKIVYVELPMYYYLSRESSIMGDFAAKRFDIFGGYSERMSYYMKKQEVDLAKRTFFLALHMLAQYREWMNQRDAASKEALKDARGMLRGYLKRYERDWNFSKREKLEKNLFVFGFWIYYLIWKIAK